MTRHDEEMIKDCVPFTKYCMLCNGFKLFGENPHCTHYMSYISDLLPFKTRCEKYTGDQNGTT
jgi:hypothetical protein